MFLTTKNLITAHRKKPVLKSLWALGILTIITFSIIYIDRLFDFVREFDQLRIFARYLKQLMLQVAEWDKVVHFLAYAVVALIGFFAVSKREYRFWIATGMIAMGITLEIIQLMVPGRTFEIYDWFSDVLGVGVAYSLFKLSRHIMSPSKLT